MSNYYRPRDTTNDINIGEATVVWCAGNQAWMIPGGKMLINREQARQVCRRISIEMGDK